MPQRPVEEVGRAALTWRDFSTEETTASREKGNGVGGTPAVSTGVPTPSTFSDEGKTESGEITGLSAGIARFRSGTRRA